MRKASCIRRVERRSKLKVTVLKISRSGLKVISVPVRSVVPSIVRGASGVPEVVTGLPRSKRI